MANENAKRKLVELAGKVQGRQTTTLENIRLEENLDRKLPNTREGVKQVIADGLQKSPGDVGRILASADDDRLIDEIVKALGK